MIDGYKFRNGKVIVVDYDENNVKTEKIREYQDNIGELLVVETVGNYLNERLHLEEESIRDNEINIVKHKNNNKELFPLLIVMNTAIASFVNLLLGKILGVNLLFSSLVSLFGSGLVLGLIFLYPNIKKIKKLEKEIKNRKNTLLGIEEEIKSNQKELRRLRNDDRVSREDISSEYIQLDCSEKIEEVDNNLSLWNVAYKGDYYLNSLRDGSLDEILVEGKCLTSGDVKKLKRILNHRIKNGR